MANATDCGPAVHPRVCGEQIKQGGVDEQENGSSPRVRGTGPSGCSSSTATRFIPRVRGTVHPHVGQRGEFRFIPACAGNRPRARRGCGRSTVHPRVCGEQSQYSIVLSSVIGSSPRVRGTAGKKGLRVGYGRFIPACAGNSPDRVTVTCALPVHPRVCGEQMRTMMNNVCSDGSSPRVRGTDVAGSVNGVHGRFIPACAGNSAVSIREIEVSSVHPRVCGEQKK